MKIFLFPFLLDLVGFLVSMRVADAAGREMQLSNLSAAMLVVAFSAGYMLACLPAGYILTRRNSRTILIASIFSLMVLSVPLFYSSTYLPVALLMTAFGVALAFAFNSFQTYMRGEAGVGSLGRTVSRYTFSWSSGIGFGFLFGGLFKSGGGALALSAASIFFCLATLALVITHSQKDHEHDSSDGRMESITSFQPEDEEANSRVLALHWRYVVIGWSICFGCNFAMRPITTFIPKFLAEQRNPAWLAGGMLFSLYIMQALIGSQAYKFRLWQYRKSPLLAQQGLLVLCFIGLWSISNLFATAIILMVLGLLFGISFFWSVYYVSNHPRSSRNVGVNEALVGVANICGVLSSQAVINYFNNDSAYYFMVAVVLTILMVAQWLWLRPHGKSAVNHLAI